MKKINIVFSFFNEEVNINELIKRTVNVLEKLKSYDYELIFVNDCSTDNSVEKIAKNPFTKKIKIINMKKKNDTTCKGYLEHFCFFKFSIPT